MSELRRVIKASKMTRCVIAVFPSVALAAIDAGCSADAMYHKCRDKALSEGKAYYRFEDEFDPNESFAGRHMCPVIAVDKDTREWSWYSSAVECALSLGVLYSTVISALNKKHLLSRQYHVRWATRPIHPRTLTEILATGKLP